MSRLCCTNGSVAGVIIGHSLALQVTAELSRCTSQASGRWLSVCSRKRQHALHRVAQENLARLPQKGCLLHRWPCRAGPRWPAHVQAAVPNAHCVT